jgi:hypothetical protein
LEEEDGSKEHKRAGKGDNETSHISNSEQPDGKDAKLYKWIIGDISKLYQSIANLNITFVNDTNYNKQQHPQSPHQLDKVQQ